MMGLRWAARIPVSEVRPPILYKETRRLDMGFSAGFLEAGRLSSESLR